MFIDTPPHFNLINDLATLIMLVAALAIQSVINWLRNKKPKKQMTMSLEMIASKVEKMEKELSPNGNKSMKDVVNRIDEKLDKTGEEVGILHRKVENIILQERGRTEFALNLSHTAQFLANQKGEITYANDAMADMFGMSKTHLVKFKWMVAIDDQEIKEDIVRRYTFAFERRILFVMTDVPIKNQKTEEVILAKISIEPVTDAKDNFMWNLGKIVELSNKSK